MVIKEKCWLCDNTAIPEFFGYCRGCGETTIGAIAPIIREIELKAE